MSTAKNEGDDLPLWFLWVVLAGATGICGILISAYFSAYVVGIVSLICLHQILTLKLPKRRAVFSTLLIMMLLVFVLINLESWYSFILLTYQNGELISTFIFR